MLANHLHLASLLHSLFDAKARLWHEGNYVLIYILCIENIINSVPLQCAVKVHRWRVRHTAQNNRHEQSGNSIWELACLVKIANKKLLQVSSDWEKYN
jgi:hypothetical protein